MASHGGAAAAGVAGRARRCRIGDYRVQKRVRIANEPPAAAPSPPLRAAANEPGRGGAARGAAAGGRAGREAQVSPPATARAPRVLHAPPMKPAPGSGPDSGSPRPARASGCEPSWRASWRGPQRRKMWPPRQPHSQAAASAETLFCSTLSLSQSCLSFHFLTVDQISLLKNSKEKKKTLNAKVGKTH